MPTPLRYRMHGDLQWQYTERGDQAAHAAEVQYLQPVTESSKAAAQNSLNPSSNPPSIGACGAMYLPLLEKFVYGVLSGEAFCSFGNEPVSAALKMPCLVVVKLERLKVRLPPTSGVRDIEKSSRVRQWLAENYAVYAPILRGSAHDLNQLDLLGGAHTLDALEKMGSEHVCIAVPVWQAAHFAEAFN